MTAYNREEYIAEAIESVLAQTFKDFELIIVDDRSKDSTIEVTKRYTSDPRVHLHLNDKNLGSFLIGTGLPNWHGASTSSMLTRTM